MGVPVAVKTGRFLHGSHELAYEIYGESGVPCLLTHGLLLDSLLNRDLARRFASVGFQVILLDLLGHGLSDKPTDPRDHRVDFYAEQVLACLDHLGIQRAMLGGISLGAITSLQAAAKAPERCLGLFLEMPVMEWSTTFAAVLLVPLLTVVDYMKWAYRPFARLLRKLPRPESEWLASGMNMASAEPEVIRAVLHGILVGPVVPPASIRAQLSMPTLIIGHVGDRLHSFRDAVALAREMPNAHMLKAHSLIELRMRPGRLWTDIQPFLHKVKALAGKSATRKPHIVTALLPSAAKAAGTSLSDEELKGQFEAAVERVQSAPANGPLKPSNETKLKMYALYRQAKDGDVQGRRPGITDPVGRFKYDAWAGIKGTSRQDAMRRYVDEVAGFEKQAARKASS